MRVKIRVIGNQYDEYYDDSDWSEWSETISFSTKRIDFDTVLTNAGDVVHGAVCTDSNDGGSDKNANMDDNDEKQAPLHTNTFEFEPLNAQISEYESIASHIAEAFTHSQPRGNVTALLSKIKNIMSKLSHIDAIYVNIKKQLNELDVCCVCFCFGFTLTLQPLCIAFSFLSQFTTSHVNHVCVHLI